MGDMGISLAWEWLIDVDLDCPLRGAGGNRHGLAKIYIVEACNDLCGKGEWRVIHAYLLGCLKGCSSLGGNGEIPAAIAAGVDKTGGARRIGHGLSK